MSSILISVKLALIKSKFDILMNERSQIIKLFSKVRHNWIGLSTFLEQNIVELHFIRRIDKGDKYKQRRRMLATRNFWLGKRLAKMKGVQLKVKHKRPKSYYKKHDMILVWDLIENDWRMISLDKWKIIDFIPLTESSEDSISDWYRKSNMKGFTESRKRSYSNK